MLRRLFAVLIVGVFILPVPAVATASPDDVQVRIDQILERYPGGVQISENAVVWDDGDVLLTLNSDLAATTRGSVGKCANGKFCVFSNAGGSGSSLSFSTCGVKDVSPLGAPVRSIANARSSGSVTAKNGSSTVLTVAAGKRVNTTKTVTTVQCN